MCARALAAAGAAPGSLIHNAYGYGLFTGGLGIHQGAIELGAAVVPASGGMTRAAGHAHPGPAARHPDLHAVVRDPAGGGARRRGAAAGGGLGLRAGLFGAEPWSLQLRARIEELLGLRALDIYGLSEVIGPGVAAECAEAADGLHVNEDHFLVEAVDPATAEPVPDGTPGELVFSSLTREAGPLLRYRTGDIAALRRGPCACGRTLVKMSQVTGRRDDMLVIRGVNIYPSEVERVLLEDNSLSPDYLLVVDERAAQPHLVCGAVRAAGPRWRGPAVPAEAELEVRLRDVLGVRVGVRLLPWGTVPRTGGGQGRPGGQVGGGGPAGARAELSRALSAGRSGRTARVTS